MLWKDLFYFSRGERNGIKVLLLLIFIIVIAPAVYRLLRPVPVYDLPESDIIMKLLGSGNNTGTEAHSAEMFGFDPNKVSEDQLRQMGIPAGVSRSVINYRNAGGVFRYREDLAKIYLLSDSLYKALEPFIELSPKPSITSAAATPPQASFSPVSRPVAEPLMISINAADTMELRMLRGIGPAFSRRISNYRDRLGGFFSVEQLLEVWGMDSARLWGFADNIYIDTTLIRRININTADFQLLLDHPYIGYNVANSIIAMRNQHGPYQAAEDIRRSVLVDDELFSRLRPYLSPGD
jgi:competence protein ComEA